MIRCCVDQNDVLLEMTRCCVDAKLVKYIECEIFVLQAFCNKCANTNFHGKTPLELRDDAREIYFSDDM